MFYTACGVVDTKWAQVLFPLLCYFNTDKWSVFRYILQSFSYATIRDTNPDEGEQINLTTNIYNSKNNNCLDIIHMPLFWPLLLVGWSWFHHDSSGLRELNHNQEVSLIRWFLKYYELTVNFLTFIDNIWDL